MSPTAPVTIRTLTRPELDTALEWAAVEGWNPGLYDGEAFYAADPRGFFGAFLDGEMVGSLSAVSYGQSFGFLGLYIVRPEYRGRGYGMALWRAALDALGKRTVGTVGLDGVVERQADYVRSGFKTAYRNVRYQGVASEPVPVGREVVSLAAVPFDVLRRYDSGLFPAPRERFLRVWIGQPYGAAFGLPDRDGLAGYGVIRKCRSGFKIGPLFADAAGGAEALFLALRNHAGPGEPIVLDVPESNLAAVALAERHGLGVVFETARMYKGAPPDLPLASIFGVTTFELG
jgi:ribosomal protein S18 acetylase RimI-like enzyme